LNANLLFTWRREYAPSGAASKDVAPTFVPVAIAGPVAPQPSPAAADSRIEIVLGSGDRVLVGADVDAVALARVVRVLVRR
ncbi:MAG: hypothetical protein ACREFY_05610, partial [Acetobacteraceae bacterium]